MSQTTGKQHIESLIRAAFEEGRCGEYYLVDLEITPNARIAAYIDGDEGVSLDACTQVNRVLQSVLDTEPGASETYELEVSSPGVNRPLKFLRQYLKHIGRTLKVTLEDDTVIEGVLRNTNHDAISLEIATKNKKEKPEVRDIFFVDIKESYVIIRFGQKK